MRYARFASSARRCRVFATAGVVVVMAGWMTGCGGGCRDRGAPPEDPTAEVPAPRLVSLAPSTTEALFALGLGPHVVGVSRFCDFPPEVAERARIGGLTDVDLEAIVRLRPDQVIAPRSQVQAREALESLGIPVLTVDQDTLPQILDSMWILGEALDRADIASVWLLEMERVMATAQAQAPTGDDRPRVLISAGRSLDSLERIYVAGRGNFYSGVLEVVGGRNAYEGEIAYPMVSGEGIVRMNPDIIIDIVPDAASGPRVSREQVLAQWRALKGVRAVEEDRVVVLTESWAARPGPRVGFIVERFAEIIQ